MSFIATRTESQVHTLFPVAVEGTDAEAGATTAPTTTVATKGAVATAGCPGQGAREALRLPVSMSVVWHFIGFGFWSGPM